MAVERHAIGQGGSAQLGERGKEIAEIDKVVIHFSGGGGARAICDEGHAAAAFEQGVFHAADLAVIDGGFLRAELRGAVVAGEKDDRILAQVQTVEFGHQFSDELVHVLDVIGVELILAGTFL